MILQSSWRGKQQRLQFAQDREAVVSCQAAVRRFLAVRTLNKLRRERQEFEVFCQHVGKIQQLWRARLVGRAARREFLERKTAAITVQAWWRAVRAQREYQAQRSSVLLLQRLLRGWRARRFVQRKRSALLALQRAAVMMKQRRKFLRTRQLMVGLQSRCRGRLAREHHRRLLEDEELRQQLRLEAERRQQERRQEAALELTSFLRTVRVRKTFLKQKRSAITIQKFWRGYWHRKVIMEQLSEMATTYKLVKDVKMRLEEATAAAKPEDSLGARTASAIDYIFSIRDVAQLIRAVKTLDFSTRISLDCCLKLTGAGSCSKTPVGQLVSLLSRCNRSEPHKEVNMASPFYLSSQYFVCAGCLHHAGHSDQHFPCCRHPRDPGPGAHHPRRHLPDHAGLQRLQPRDFLQVLRCPPVSLRLGGCELISFFNFHYFHFFPSRCSAS